MLAAERCVRLAEVAQDGGAQAVRGGAVERHLAQALLVGGVGALGVLGRRARGQRLLVRALQQELPRLHVALVVDEHAVGRRAVAPGAARLLVVALQVAGHVVVDDERDVALVDAHAEGVRGHHDGRAVKDEVLLVALALFGREARVVARGAHARFAQKVCDLLHVLAGGAVHDAALAGVLSHEAQEARALGLGLGALHAIVEVGPVKPRNHDDRVAQGQAPGYVLAHGGRRGGRERAHRGARAARGLKALHELRDAQVARAEVLAPLRDAVGLVHGHQGHVHAAREVQESRVLQPLGRHVEQRERAGLRPRERLRALGGRKAAVDARRRHARLLQRLHLVGHERDERRDDDGRAAERKRGHLVHERLARARGHDAQHVAPGQHLLHELPLRGAEVGVAEPLAQHRPRVVYRGPRDACARRAHRPSPARSSALAWSKRQRAWMSGYFSWSTSPKNMAAGRAHTPNGG